jgi:hypothetical protein
MKALRDIDTDEPVLRKPSWRSGLHELVAGDAVVGQLDVSSWSGGSLAEAADERWKIDRPRGFTQRRIRVLDASTEDEVAEVRRDGWGRRAEVGLGEHRYELRARAWWKPHWAWTEDGAELVTLSTRDTLREEMGRIRLSDALRASPHASLLVLLGAHLALLAGREAAGAAAAGATAGGATAAGGS